MSADTILYLSRGDVTAALDHIDVFGAAASALTAHGRGETTLPAEAYLGWEHEGETLRSLCMPASIDSVPGVKIINANPANPARGLPRASGLTLLFEADTGRPLCVMEGARISCLRTAAVTAIATKLLAAAPVERLALIGAGALARCHLRLLVPRLPRLREIRVYDHDRERATTLAAARSLIVCDSAEQAIGAAQLIVTVTTTTSPYIRYEWLQPGALIVNVSLDDLMPDVFLRADKLFVDDWNLIAADEHRLLGRMLRDGTIARPSHQGAREIDGELGQLLASGHRGRSRPDEIIVVNPFGLAIEDLAIAKHVYQYARASGLGAHLNR
jgi:ornithine cyclodeaminase/alanine dehydrogenase-like protein (mu-crystallin family)